MITRSHAHACTHSMHVLIKKKVHYYSSLLVGITEDGKLILFLVLACGTNSETYCTTKRKGPSRLSNIVITSHRRRGERRNILGS